MQLVTKYKFLPLLHFDMHQRVIYSLKDKLLELVYSTETTFKLRTLKFSWAFYTVTRSSTQDG